MRGLLHRIERGVLHAERLEDALPRELVERHPGRDLDRAQQDVEAELRCTPSVCPAGNRAAPSSRGMICATVSPAFGITSALLLALMPPLIRPEVCVKRSRTVISRSAGTTRSASLP